MEGNNKSFYNNKCVIEFIDDGRVRKAFYNKNKNYKEFNFLQTLHTIFPGKKVGEWCLKVVKPLDYLGDKQGFVMEKANGKTLDKYYRNNKDVFYCAGVWLAYFHKALKKDSNILSFGDFHRNNLLIDKKSKKIIAIDPNPEVAFKHSQEYDFYSMINSIINGALKHFMFPKRFINEFLNGYASVKKIPFWDIEQINIISNHYLRKRAKKIQKTRFILKAPHAASNLLVKVYLQIYVNKKIENTMKSGDENE